jgi:hypothetical protein
MKKAIFGLGCFWGPEEKFSKLNGITNTEVGYCGGNNSKTSYEEVCTGQTNHAEVVKIEFDEKVISYEEIVNFFLRYTIQQLLIDKVLTLALNIEVKFSFMMMNKKKLLKKLKKI